MRFRLVALAVVLAAVASPVRAADRVWTGLVLATQERPARPAPAELEPYRAALTKVFGFNTFYLLGAKSRKIVTGSEEWIVPTREVFLKLRCTGRDATSYTLQVELYVRKELVVTSTVRLARDAPLYIRGPAWGKGRLVFILEIQ